MSNVDGVPPRANGQVLSPLLMNEIHEIEVGAREDGETVLRDNGTGCDPSYAACSFVAFQRPYSQAELAGTGIGLATVHRIIARRRGRVRADGAPGQGATFSFTLGRVVRDPAEAEPRP